MNSLGVAVNFSSYPGFVPATTITVALALFVAGPVGDRLGCSRGVARLLVASLGIILAATLTPGRADPLHELPPGSLVCDLSRTGAAPWVKYLQLDETTLNLILFVPFGVAIALLPRSRAKVGIALAAVVLPFAIEGIQLGATPLGRACQSGDVFDNLAGLVLGLGAGTAARTMWRRPACWSATATQPMSSPPATPPVHPAR